MKVYKKYLELLVLLVQGTNGILSLKESRIRDTFARKLNEEYAIFVAEREEIYKKFCVKNEKGEPEIKNNQYSFEPDILEEINKELVDLGEEKVEILPLGPVKMFLELSAYKPKVGEVEIIDELLNQE